MRELNQRPTWLTQVVLTSLGETRNLTYL